MTPHQPNHASRREPGTPLIHNPGRHTASGSSSQDSVHQPVAIRVSPIIDNPPPPSNLAAQKASKSIGAFEIKFLIQEDLAQQLLAWSQANLESDPHSDPLLGNGYRVNSLYLDTSQFDVFHRSEGFRQQKFRLRRYGAESTVWFEQKRKRHGLVRKKRVGVNETELPKRLIQPADAEWEGHWYRQRIDERLLKPTCQITYERFAFVKSINGSPARLTIDRKLVAIPTTEWSVPSVPLEGTPLLNGTRILELKFRGAMPVLFRDLVERYRLQVTSFSKYRTAIERCYGVSSNRDQSAAPSST